VIDELRETETPSLNCDSKKSGTKSDGLVRPITTNKRSKDGRASPLGSTGEEEMPPSSNLAWLHFDDDDFQSVASSADSSHTSKSLATFIETVISCQPRTKRHVAKTPTDRLMILQKNLEKEVRIEAGDVEARSVAMPDIERPVNFIEERSNHSTEVAKVNKDQAVFRRKSASSLGSVSIASGKSFTGNFSIGRLEPVPESKSSDNQSTKDRPCDEERDLRVCCGQNAFWRLNLIRQAFDYLVRLFELDNESRRIVKLAIPFTIGEFALSICENIHMLLVSRFLGTPAVAAVTAVDIFLGTTGEFLGGVIDGQISITSHALGVGNNYLAGQYVQQAQIVFTLMFIPTYVFWWFYVYPATLWLGMSESVAHMAQAYARVEMFNDWMDYMSCSVHGMYEVTDHEWFSTFADVVFEILGFAAIIPAFIYIDGVNLVTLAYIDMGLNALEIMLAILYPLYKGWLKIFIPGWLGNFSLTNTSGLWNLLRTALPLSFGELVAYGEWELLTIFAAHNGQAYLSAWGLLGTLWETFESLTEGIGDAAEIRVAYHLGRGEPKAAEVSGFKGAIIGTVVAFVATSIFWILGEDIPRWFSTDPLVQQAMLGAIPLMGIGNLSMAFGMMCWGVIGAQGRYSLATAWLFVSSWLVTLPLAAIFVYVFGYGIQGIVAAATIGYSCLSIILIFIMARSDWSKLSGVIQERNAIVGETMSSDSESSASSNSSSFIPSVESSSVATSSYAPGKTPSDSSLNPSTISSSTFPRPRSSSLNPRSIITSSNAPSVAPSNEGSAASYISSQSRTMSSLGPAEANGLHWI